MKFKVGDKIFTSKEQPIMLILDDQDKQNLANMFPDAYQMCEYDETKYSEEEIREFMKV